ncbi:hypothetical protein MTO96_010414 [Rhipicephalus appendiculatus]
MKYTRSRKLNVPSLLRKLGFTARTSRSKRHDGGELKWHAIGVPSPIRSCYDLCVNARSTARGLRRVAFCCVEPGNEDAHLDFCCTACVVSPAGHRNGCSKEFKATDSRKAKGSAAQRRYRRAGDSVGRAAVAAATVLGRRRTGGQPSNRTGRLLPSQRVLAATGALRRDQRFRCACLLCGSFLQPPPQLAAVRVACSTFSRVVEWLEREHGERPGEDAVVAVSRPASRHLTWKGSLALATAISLRIRPEE